MKAIVFTVGALKAFQSLPKATRLTIAAKLQRFGRHRAVFVETADEIRVFAVGDRRDVYD